MTEQEYIDATDLRSLRTALEVMRHVGPNDKSKAIEELIAEEITRLEPVVESALARGRRG